MTLNPDDIEDSKRLLWEIIQELYDDETTVMNIAIRLNKSKSLINSCLYKYRGKLFISDTKQEWAPLWKLSQESINTYDLVHSTSIPSENIDRFGSLFCQECDNLFSQNFCTNPSCDENPIPQNAEHIPSFVKGGGEENSISPMRYLGYSVGKDFGKKEKRKALLQYIFCAQFWTPKDAQNKLYVDQWGPPDSEKRRNKMILHLGGINVGAKSKKHHQRREIDINVLRDLECSKCSELECKGTVMYRSKFCYKHRNIE